MGRKQLNQRFVKKGLDNFGLVLVRIWSKYGHALLTKIDAKTKKASVLSEAATLVQLYC